MDRPFRAEGRLAAVELHVHDAQVALYHVEADDGAVLVGDAAVSLRLGGGVESRRVAVLRGIGQAGDVAHAVEVDVAGPDVAVPIQQTSAAVSPIAAPARHRAGETRDGVLGDQVAGDHEPELEGYGREAQLEAGRQLVPHPGAAAPVVGRRRLEDALGRPEEPERVRVVLGGGHKFGRRELEARDVAAVGHAGPDAEELVVQSEDVRPLGEQFGDCNIH